VPKPYLFVSLGLALSEKQIPQVVEKIEKPREQIEGVESSIVLRRQTLYPLSYGRVVLARAIVSCRLFASRGALPDYGSRPKTATLEGVAT
jgi:hypothetical protein